MHVQINYRIYLCLHVLYIVAVVIVFYISFICNKLCKNSRVCLAVCLPERF